MTDQEVGFSDRFARPNRLRIAAVAGASLAIVLVTAVTMGASPAPTGSTGAAPSASPSPSGSAQTPGGRDGPKGRFGDFGGFGRHAFPGGPVREAVTVSAIDGSQVSLETDDGWTRTIDVTGTTEITKGGQVATLADLEVGDEIRFRQSRAADGSYTIDAIDVVVPTVLGVVTAVDSSSITIRERDGTSRTIATTDSTAYRFGRDAGARTDVVVGATIQAQGTEGTNDAFTATTVVVEPAHAAGPVKAKTATTITIERRDGTDLTVTVGDDTTYEVAGVTNAGLGDVEVGMQVSVSGRAADKGSIAATDVRAGIPGWDFRGGPWGSAPGRAAPSVSPDGSTNDG